MDPPTTELVPRVMLTSVGALTVSGAEACRTPAVAVTVVNVSAATAAALMVTLLVVVWPARIVNVVGEKLRMPLGLPVRFTVRFDAIGLASVTVPLTVLVLTPPTIVGALSVRLRLSGNTVSVSVAGLPTEGVAVIVTGVDAVTTLVEIDIECDVLFVVKGTGVWGAADVLELVSVTVKPDGAGPFKVSVAPIALPPTTDFGDAIVSVSAGGVTVSGAVKLPPFRLALMFAFTVDDTGVVETVKVPVVCAPAIEAVPRTVTPFTVLSLETVTVKPPVGAGLEIVTVPVDGLLPTTVVGLSARLTSVGAVTVSGADAPNTPPVAVTVVDVFVATAMAPTVVVAVVCPAWIVAVVGAKLRMPFGLPLKVTVRLDAIGLARVTVPVTVLLLPPTIVEALSERLRLSGSTVRVSVAAVPTLGVAVIVAGVCVVTTLVAIVIVLLVLPAVKGTGVWGATDVLELASVTV